MQFTGQRDTDVYILSQLSLQNLRQTCQINQYLSNLCQNDADLKFKIKLAQHQINQFLNILKQRQLVILQPTSSQESFKSFRSILDYIDADIDLGDDTIETLDYYNRFFVYFLELLYIPHSNQYFITFYLHTHWRDLELKDMFTVLSFHHFVYELNINQLNEFLLHLFYNQMVLSF
jgi:hypothetical protein